MGHIQVAVLAGLNSGVGRWNGLSARDKGDAVALLEGGFGFGRARFCAETLFEGLGTSVIFGEDLRKPV